ncbi:hypothetical protein RFI_03838 [Reticulomyxa filosa]|uniref:Uncharacterized protein n=1 Tax=Reticulomyxa filosa TaxID=46433 RepID=X6P3Z2_RETFI|nr:hypothetical protein RFI_03838 [Reticulomyxa filosa]|eukprot:ETO33270.1 hypothetical protein RFI_03838 [Reticulomyxa filosa]
MAHSLIKVFHSIFVHIKAVNSPLRNNFNAIIWCNIRQNKIIENGLNIANIEFDRRPRIQKIIDLKWINEEDVKVHYIILYFLYSHEGNDKIISIKKIDIDVLYFEEEILKSLHLQSLSIDVSFSINPATVWILDIGNVKDNGQHNNCSNQPKLDDIASYSILILFAIHKWSKHFHQQITGKKDKPKNVFQKLYIQTRKYVVNIEKENGNDDLATIRQKGQHRSHYNNQSADIDKEDAKVDV